MSDEAKKKEGSCEDGTCSCECVPLEYTIGHAEALIASIEGGFRAPDCCKITAMQFGLMVLIKTADAKHQLTREAAIGYFASLYDTLSVETAQAHLADALQKALAVRMLMARGQGRGGAHIKEGD